MRGMGNYLIWIGNSGKQSGEEDFEGKGTACAKALRWHIEK